MAKFHRLLQGAKGTFDWVIIDTPPVLAVTDASIIADEVDLTLLVGRFKFSQIPLMEQVLGHFNRIGHSFCGVVLNHFEYGRHYYYRGDYYRHYHYYYGHKPPETTWDKIVRTFTRKKPKESAPRRATV